MKYLLAYSAVTALLFALIWGVPLLTTPSSLPTTSTRSDTELRHQPPLPVEDTEKNKATVSPPEAETVNATMNAKRIEIPEPEGTQGNTLPPAHPNQQPAAATGEKIQELPTADAAFEKLQLGSIDFRNNSIALDTRSLEKLDSLVPKLKTYGTDVSFEIRGFTDNKGAVEYIQWLSQKRAEKVRSFLIHRGLNPERLTAIGFGGENPVADNGTEAGRKENRRIEIQPFRHP